MQCQFCRTPGLPICHECREILAANDASPEPAPPRVPPNDHRRSARPTGHHPVERRGRIKLHRSNR